MDPAWGLSLQASSQRLPSLPYGGQGPSLVSSPTSESLRKEAWSSFSTLLPSLTKECLSPPTCSELPPDGSAQSPASPQAAAKEGLAWFLGPALHARDGKGRIVSLSSVLPEESVRL